MEKHYSDESFLARWVSGELTDKELEDFKASSEYEDFVKINNTSQNLNVPQYDKATALRELQNKIESPEEKDSKIISLRSYLKYVAVASVILLLGYFLFFNTSKTLTTDFGEQLAITLPDNSEVVLNSKSIVTYDKKEWEVNRTLNLEGEAYFKVKKGSDFTVKTKEGNITVLGTEFNVSTDKDYIEVQCFEGKVRVINKVKEASVLTKGKAIRSINNVIENWDFTATKPTWTDNESSYTRAPLQKVINDLQAQYNIKVDASEINLNQRYTGSFTHTNINLAFQTVFDAMEISYTFGNNKEVILFKNQ